MGKRLKELRTYQALLSVVLLFVMLHMGVKFMNAGFNYQQVVPFRIFCSCFAGLIIVNMNPKYYLTVYSLVWVPVCYLATHIGYEKQLIPDVCNYQFTDVIRLGKLVVLLWGWMLIALFRQIIKENLIGRFLKALTTGPLWQRLPVFLWLVYVPVLTVFNPGYYYVILFTLGFSAFFIICGDAKTRKRLFYSYLIAMVLSLIFISYKSLRHRPYDTERYLLYFVNENMAGMYLGSAALAMATLLDAAWRMHKGSLRKIALVVLNLLAAWMGVLAVYNYTRTYLTGLLFAVLVYFVIRMLRSREKRGAIVLHFVLPFLLTLLLFLPGYYLIRYVPAMFDEPVYFAAEFDNPTRVHPGDPADSPKYTSLSRFLTLSLGKWGIEVHLDEEYSPTEEGSEEALSIDEDRDVSNGRTDIWKLFLGNMTIGGHYPGHIITEDDKLIYHAHNTYLQNMYQYGIPAGLLFALLIGCAYLRAVWVARKQKKLTVSVVYPLLALGLMGFGMLTEWSGHPIYPFGLALMFALVCVLYPADAEKNAE